MSPDGAWSANEDTAGFAPNHEDELEGLLGPVESSNTLLLKRQSSTSTTSEALTENTIENE